MSLPHLFLYINPFSNIEVHMVQILEWILKLGEVNDMCNIMFSKRVSDWDGYHPKHVLPRI